MSFDRLIHVGAALGLWWAVGRVRRWRAERAAGGADLLTAGDAGARALAEVRASWGAWAMLPGVLLGASVPDWDLWVGGIGFHRSPLFHSALPVGVVAGLLWVLGKRAWLRGNLLRGLAVGVASHLLWDIVQYGDVRWIKGGNADRLFLLANAVALVAWACVQRGADGVADPRASSPPVA